MSARAEFDTLCLRAVSTSPDIHRLSWSEDWRLAGGGWLRRPGRAAVRQDSPSGASDGPVSVNLKIDCANLVSRIEVCDPVFDSVLCGLDLSSPLLFPGWGALGPDDFWVDFEGGLVWMREVASYPVEWDAVDSVIGRANDERPGGLSGWRLPSPADLGGLSRAIKRDGSGDLFRGRSGVPDALWCRPRQSGGCAAVLLWGESDSFRGFDFVRGPGGSLTQLHLELPALLVNDSLSHTGR